MYEQTNLVHKCDLSKVTELKESISNDYITSLFRYDCHMNTFLNKTLGFHKTSVRNC